MILLEGPKFDLSGLLTGIAGALLGFLGAWLKWKTKK